MSDGAHRGLPEIRAAFEATWRALVDETYRLDQREWIAEGDSAAACIYRFDWSAKINGVPSSGGGRGTTVLQRLGDRWWIVHEHLSAMPGQAMRGLSGMTRPMSTR